MNSEIVPRLLASEVECNEAVVARDGLMDAWRTGQVPHDITSNPFMPAAYARVVTGFLRDLAAAGSRLPFCHLGQQRTIEPLRFVEDAIDADPSLAKARVLRTESRAIPRDEAAV